MMPSYADVIERILDLERAEAHRRDEEMASEPAGPATVEALAAAQQARGQIHPSYVDFLKLHDGWCHFHFGIRLYGTEVLAGEEYAEAEETLEYTEDASEEIQQALIIGDDENSAALIMLVASGEIVELFYEEVDRHTDLAAFFEARVQALTEARAHAIRTIENTREQWTSAWRSVQMSALSDELGALREGSTAVEPPDATDDRAVLPSELIAHDTEKQVCAAVDLGLVLYLAACPSPDEVVACLQAFRRHFPVDGLEWMQGHLYSFHTEPVPEPLPADFADQLTVDDSGWFGLRATSGDAHPQHILNVRGVPPELDDSGENARASFVEVLVPADASPASLQALAVELVALLPVACGHGGYFARAHNDGDDPDPWDVIHAWCKDHLALEVSYVDGFLEQALHRHRGAGWLTVLGEPYAGLLIEVSTLEGVEVVDAGSSRVVIAGEPTLSGRFPSEIASVTRALEPMLLTTWSKRGMITMGGIYFSTHAQQLPGGFRRHHATESYLRRLIDPGAFQGPSALDRAMEAISTLRSTLKKKDLTAWKKLSDPDAVTDLAEGLACLSAGAWVAGGAAAVDALEFAAAFPGIAPKEVYNNLLHWLLHEGRLADAVGWLPTAEWSGVEEENTGTLHNIACVFVADGQLDEAMRVLQILATTDHDRDVILGETDFQPLHGRPDWCALFSP